jgi:hypothetical protein
MYITKTEDDVISGNGFRKKMISLAANRRRHLSMPNRFLEKRVRLPSYRGYKGRRPIKIRN